MKKAFRRSDFTEDMNFIQKAAKIMITLKKRYNFPFHLLSSYFQSGKLPPNMEWDLIQLLGGHGRNDVTKSIMAGRELAESLSSRAKEGELEEKGWIYKKLPKSFSEYGNDYFKKQNLDKGKGWYGEPERHSQARKTGKADTLDFCLYDMAITLDVTRGPGRPKLRGLKAGTPSAMVSGAKRTKVGRSLGPEGFQVGGVESITVPFELMNTETGQIFKGNVVENLEKNIKQLTPVSSSNVRGVGQFNNELLVQFHPKGLTPLRTYRYQFETPQMAEEAYRGLTTTGSPGRWIWQNVRGHTKGEAVTPSKIGPALLTGNPTIGGTTKSLVDYKISNRVPVQRVQGFEGGVSKLKRITSNPTTNPQTGQMIESLLGTRKGFRDIGLPRTAILSKLPKIDMTMTYVGTLVKDNISELEDWIKSKLNITNPDDVKAASFAIINSRKKKKSEKREQENKFHKNKTFLSKIKKIENIEKKYPNVEVGFGISKSGKFTGKREESLLVGGMNRGTFHTEARKELGEELEYVLHNHPYDETFSKVFSFEDLKSASMLGFKPVITYKDKEGNRYIKKMEKVPSYQSLVKEYKSLFDEWEKGFDQIFETKEAGEKHEKSIFPKIERFEKKYGIKTIKLKQKKPKEKSWKKSWETLGEEMDRLRKARKMYKEYKTIKERHLQKQIYGSYRSDTISTRETKNYVRKRQFEPSECESGTYRTFKIGKGKKAIGCKVNGKFKVQSILEPKSKKDFLLDTIPLKEFKQITYDFQNDFIVLHGRIARSGPYQYKKNGQWITLYKDYNNLKSVYPKYDYLPLKVSEKDKSHFAQEFGFAYNFRPNPDTEEIEADLVILDETQFNEIKNKDYHVSPGYHDYIEGNKQYVLDVDHVALSLGDEIGRACTGTNEYGKSCTTVQPIINHDQNLSQEVVIK